MKLETYIEKDFDYHIEHAKTTLECEGNLPERVRLLLNVIVSVCEKGKRLEAENADLRNQLREAMEKY